MNLVTSIPAEQLALIIAATIAVANGINNKAKFENNNMKTGVVILVGIYLVVNFRYSQDFPILKSINDYIVLFFGAFGVYDFINKPAKARVELANVEQQKVDLDIIRHEAEVNAEYYLNQEQQMLDNQIGDEENEPEELEE